MQLRYYQHEAIDAIFDHFENHDSNPIVALPTGTGKSVVIAEFLKRVFESFPGQRVAMLTHVKELIQQNYDELRTLWPLAPVGIYSAGLGRKEVLPIIFGGIKSVVKKAKEIGALDLIIVDECHLVSPHEDTFYRKFFEEQKTMNDNVKVIGLTATPYRLGQGMLTENFHGKNGKEHAALFGRVCYDATSFKAFNRLVDEGFLAPLIPLRTETQVDVSEVHKRGGEFVEKEIQIAFDRDEITRAAIDETITAATGDERCRWLVFASGVAHAEHVAKQFCERGYEARCVCGDTASSERENNVIWFKERTSDVRVLVNNSVFTTGFNCPQLDVIVVLRATMSPGLWVQMLGRGTRPSDGKQNCLVLDFAGNTERLGPINDPVIPRSRGSGEGGVAPVRLCENCGAYSHASLRVCPHCGLEFALKTKLKTIASRRDLIKRDEVTVLDFDVDNVAYSRHRGRAGKPDSLKVIYTCGLRFFREWVCLGHTGYARFRAEKWWALRTDAHAPARAPTSVEEALSTTNFLKTPKKITVAIGGRHDEVTAAHF
jgi:DNA repair protein RadD